MKAKRYSACALTLALVSSIVSHAGAQNVAYEQTNLVSDIPGVAQHVDSNLVNP